MSAEREVVVLGGGAAGVAAALSATRAGARVTLVSRAVGATALSSGALDVVGDAHERHGDPWAGRPTASELLQRLVRRCPQHPLALAGVDSERAQRVLDQLCQELPLLSPRSLDRPALVLPTDLGTFKSTNLASRAAAPGDMCKLQGGRLGVVTCRGVLGQDASQLAQGYRHAAAAGGLELHAEPLTVELLRFQGEERLPPAQLARQLDRPAAQQRLGEQLRRLVQRHRLSHLLLPPIMGLDDAPDVCQRLSEACHVPVFEMLASHPGSVPGLRLQRQLDQALDRHRIRRVSRTASGLSAAHGSVHAVQLEPTGELPAQAVVLATGKFIGGGLERRQGRLREPLAGLPVWIDHQGPDPGHLGRQMARQVEGPHPLLRAGLRADATLRPLGRSGAPAQSNLFAAGSVLGGYDYIRGRCGLGTALITGWLAGAAAGEARA